MENKHSSLMVSSMRLRKEEQTSFYQRLLDSTHYCSSWLVEESLGRTLKPKLPLITAYECVEGGYMLTYVVKVLSIHSITITIFYYY